jgi:hypothetical protein
VPGRLTRHVRRCQLGALPASSAGAINGAATSPQDIAAHTGMVPDLGEPAVFEAIKSELRDGTLTRARLFDLVGRLPTM